MKLNKEHTLRHLGSHYMIVDSRTDAANLTNVYVLNETAAYLWNGVQNKEFNANTLVEMLCEEYDVSETKAAEDVAKLLEVWQENRIVLS